jgi:hypothetical protein
MPSNLSTLARYRVRDRAFGIVALSLTVWLFWAMLFMPTPRRPDIETAPVGGAEIAKLPPIDALGHLVDLSADE